MVSSITCLSLNNAFPRTTFSFREELLHFAVPLLIEVFVVRMDCRLWKRTSRGDYTFLNVYVLSFWNGFIQWTALIMLNNLPYFLQIRIEHSPTRSKRYEYKIHPMLFNYL